MAWQSSQVWLGMSCLSTIPPFSSTGRSKVGLTLQERCTWEQYMIAIEVRQLFDMSQACMQM
eukprot:5947318-Amphidinium_carterae.1